MPRTLTRPRLPHSRSPHPARTGGCEVGIQPALWGIASTATQPLLSSPRAYLASSVAGCGKSIAAGTWFPPHPRPLTSSSGGSCRRCPSRPPSAAGVVRGNEGFLSHLPLLGPGARIRRTLRDRAVHRRSSLPLQRRARRADCPLRSRWGTLQRKMPRQLDRAIVKRTMAHRARPPLRHPGHLAGCSATTRTTRSSFACSMRALGLSGSFIATSRSCFRG